MSNATDYAENQVVDFIRGEPMGLSGSWYIGLLSSFDSDDSPIEFVGSDYSRQPIARSLTTWSGTQGPGSVNVSTGSSHTTSNNEEVDFGSGHSGTATHWGVFDQETGGQLWFAVPFELPITINPGDEVNFVPGELAISVGLSGGLTNYGSNRLIDHLFREEDFEWPSPMYVAYFITPSSNATPGTEPLGGYARVALASSLAALAGTQGAGTTAPSDGESGETSNNEAIVFPAPSGTQGDVSHAGIMDAATLGNMLFQAELAGGAVVTVGAGVSAPRFDPGQLRITVR